MRIANSLARGAILLAAVTAYLAGVFQWPARSFAVAGPGDWLDPYLINGILEHWYWSITHLSDPASPVMYFPAHGTLGYSHGLIGTRRSTSWPGPSFIRSRLLHSRSFS